MSRISMQTRAVATLILLALGLLLVRLFETNARYTLGHPHWVDIAIQTLLWMLFITHVVIAGIMFLQRARWLPSDAAMFLFIGTKALLWFDLATKYVMAGRGVMLDIAYIYVIVALATLHLDIRMIRRYVIVTPDEDENPTWDGATERRSELPGRRATDQIMG